jgi:hypothetical protein
MGIKIKMIPPELIKSAKTIYAAVTIKDEDTGKTYLKAMPFPPESPMYFDVVDAGIGFATLEFCQKFAEESTALETRIRKEENTFLDKGIEEEPEKEEKVVKAIRKIEPHVKPKKNATTRQKK